MSEVLGTVVVVMVIGVIFAVISGQRRGASKSGGTKQLQEIANRLSPFLQAAPRPADLRDHDDFRTGVSLLRDQRYETSDLIGYFQGDNIVVSCLAVEALRERGDPAGISGVIDSIGHVAWWPFYFALQYVQTAPPDRPVLGAVLAQVQEPWSQPAPRAAIADFARQRASAEEDFSFGDRLDSLSDEAAEYLEQLFQALGGVVPVQLRSEFQNWRTEKIDQGFLRSIGPVWTEREVLDRGPVLEHAALVQALAEVESLLTAPEPRSVLLVGESGVGKSALGDLIGRRLNEKGWVVFEAGYSELMAGQIYLGQLQERLQQLIQHIRGRRVLWRIPEFHAMAMAGRHEYGPTGALDVLLPYIEQGEVVLLGETQPGTFERLVQSTPRISTALAVTRIKPTSSVATEDLARLWLDKKENVTAAESQLIPEACALSEQYLADRAAPGNVLELLQRTAQRLTARGGTLPAALAPRDLIATLAQITGLPSAILDEREELDVQGLRSLFSRRILGQQGAVECLVQRVAMIKAGVTDPTRPYGVFLFAGPTGTGKTETAKTLAEFLFGSPDRMIRLDMSEFQTSESLDRILGTADVQDTSSLVQQIRRQPFSVILLDEFEKAHERVWDVFLQVFDDGRLTSRRGFTANFRHSIIVLTSNLGGMMPTGTLPGFGARREEFSSKSVLRAVEKTFRKEFLNRLDQVIVFQPLGRQLMRQILEQELGDVFRRRGLRSRGWAVEWDDAAVEFLLDKGFTVDLGARPLKRAIERYLLAPLALTIVEHRYPKGDQFLFVRCKDDELVVEFVDPDAPSETPAAAEVADKEAVTPPLDFTVRGVALHARGSSGEVEYLARDYEDLRSEVQGADWQERKSTALEMTQLEGFWNSPDRFEILGQVEYQDRIESALRGAGSVLGRLRSGAKRDRTRHYTADLVATLAQRLYLIGEACDDVQRNGPRESFLAVEASPDAGIFADETNAFAAELGQMYLDWANRRRMRVEVLHRDEPNSSQPYRLILAVTGFGSYSILAPESGLHVLQRPTAATKFERSKVHVRVLPQTGAPPEPGRSGLGRQAEEALAQEHPADLKVVRRYQRDPSPLVRDAVRGWRTGRLDQVLAGNFDIIENT